MKPNLRLNFSSSLLVLLLSILFMQSCQPEPVGPNGPPPDPVDDNRKVKAGVIGVVVDESNQPVNGAIVKSGSATTTTDSKGVFRFNNIDLSAANGHVRVEAPGYFTGNRTFITIAGRTHNVRIKLIPKLNSGNFQGISGGTISLPGGGKLIIPSTAVTDANGATYAGTVQVAMTWIDPTDEDLPQVIPGDLRGITTEGEERGLQTFGMLGVELTGSGGQPLKIASGKTAELSFPIPSSLLAKAPATIDLWHFDEADGRWKQEGKATKNGDKYIGQVSHFSFWNCDAPFPLVGLCMRVVVSGNESPMNSVLVKIRRTSDNIASYGITDSAGNLCGAIPANEPLVLELLNQCHQVVYTQNIGPFSSSADIGTITAIIPSANSLTITGGVKDCNNVDVASGAVFLHTSNGYFYTLPIVNGIFTATLLNCGGATTTISAVGIDYSNNQQGIASTAYGSSGTIDMGILQACGVSATQFFNVSIAGVASNYVFPADSLQAVSRPGSGGFTTNTSIGAMRMNNSAEIGLDFLNNAAPGSYAIQSLTIRETAGSNGTSEILTPSPVVTISAFGPVTTGFIEGSFSVQMNFAGTPKQVEGSFRVRRAN